MRIAFIHDWEPDFLQEMTWKDGLAKAVSLLSQRHTLQFFTCGQRNEEWQHPFFPIQVRRTGDDMTQAVRDFAPDVILHWADATRPNAKTLHSLGKPMALCFAGGNTNGDTAQYFDHFFVESQVYADAFSSKQKSVSIAFGTNDELFQPIPQQPKVWDVVFPATFCEWKRHELFTDSTQGLSRACFGYMYDRQEQWCYEYPRSRGVAVFPHVSADVLRHIFAASRAVLITSRADGGSQRTVLEAMAMNVPVIAMSDSDKTTEYLKDSGIGWISEPRAGFVKDKVMEALQSPPIDSRAYIMSKWTAKHYADNLEAGLLKLCQN